MSGLDATAPSPRVNFQLLPQYVGKRVTLVGKVEGVEGSTLRLRTSDDGVVSVSLQSTAPQASVLEVTGVVNSPNAITEESCCPFSDNFDMANYNELCKLTSAQQYRHMFMP